jgi:hypothetical protein
MMFQNILENRWFSRGGIHAEEAQGEMTAYDGNKIKQEVQFRRRLLPNTATFRASQNARLTTKISMD